MQNETSELAFRRWDVGTTEWSAGDGSYNTVIFKEPHTLWKISFVRCGTLLCRARPHFAILFVFVVKGKKKRGISFSLSIHYPLRGWTATQHVPSSCLDPKSFPLSFPSQYLTLGHEGPPQFIIIIIIIIIIIKSSDQWRKLHTEDLNGLNS